MSLISTSLRNRYSQLLSQSTASIHRHKQADMASELVTLASTVTSGDARDSYGIGGVIGEFERELQTLFDKPACVFLPTGTLAQCAALKCYSELTGRNGVGLHPTSHLVLHEHDAVQCLWGLTVQSFGKAQKVVGAEDTDSLDPTTLTAIIVESPMREIGGEIPAWDTLCALRHWCDEHLVYMHLDGARIWQTMPYYDRELAEIASLFDSLYVSFYKDLGGITGAALLGSQTLIRDTKIWARRAGGNPITMYPDVLAARAGLKQHLPEMKEYVAYTRTLCDKLTENGYILIPDKPRAALFHIEFTIPPEALAARLCDYAEQTGIMVLPLPRSGNANGCVCEVSVGDLALRHAPDFWVTHLHRALSSG